MHGELAHVPPVLHTEPAGHVPQSSEPPQPSPAGPHDRFSAEQVSGWHDGAPHTPGVPPPPQVCGSLQLPQPPSMTLPQPSPAGPHEIPCAAHDTGTQFPPSSTPH